MNIENALIGFRWVLFQHEMTEHTFIL